MPDKKVLVIGKGAREDVIARLMRLGSPLEVSKVFIAPGNGGTRLRGDNVPQVVGGDALLRFALENKIDLTVVGPENHFGEGDGIVNIFRKAGLRIFGPTKEAAQLELSKVYAKLAMREAGIPTAPFEIFTDYSEALRHIRSHGAPIVVKADGPALGKGAYPCEKSKEAEDAVREIMVEKVHGTAGNAVVVEKFLRGWEISVHAIPVGDDDALIFPVPQDHKRVNDGDQGANTGGMGAIAPHPGVSIKLLATIKERIILPIFRLMKKRGAPFTGCLFVGIIVTPEEDPMVLEFNVRFGDPEFPTVGRLLKTPLFNILMACADETPPAHLDIEWHPKASAGIVLASAGYPGLYKKGYPITGIEEAEKLPGVVVFHAGTVWHDGKLVTDGGRILTVTATHDSLRGAIDRAYQAAALINFDGKQNRNDIGAKALAHSEC